jgi:threonine dehydrogenase-like Zn-dependent dehydrogenase
VIELTGAYPALHQAIRLAGVGGTVIAAGFYQRPAAALALGEEFHTTRSQRSRRRSPACRPPCGIAGVGIGCTSR